MGSIRRDKHFAFEEARLGPRGEIYPGKYEMISLIACDSLRFPIEENVKP